MIDNGGVVIRLTWNLYSSNVVMTEWVPLVPPPNATLVLMPASISENAGVSTVTATLDRTTSAATTITVSAAAVAPAVSGDFALSSTRTLTIAAGATTSTGTVTIAANDNDVDAPDKWVTVSGTATGDVVEDPSDVRLTIADDDDTPTLSIDSPSVTEGDSGTATLTFTVTLSAASAQTVTVGYADAGTGTATSGTDYTAIPAGTLTFAAGTTSQPIAVTVTGDATDEADETVVVRLSSPVNATLAAASGTGTIADDDAPTLSIDSPSVTEGDSGTATLTFTVTLSAASAQTVTVGYADAGTGTATSGTDYTAIPAGTLTFAAGTTSQPIAVTVTGDATDEADETVVVRLSSPVNATLAAASGTGTIADDDAPTLSIDSPSVTEGDSGTATLTFTVTLSAASAQTVTVGYADAGTGTATSGTDYTAIPAGTLTFAAGTTSQPIAVTVTGDATDEADETVVVRLSSPVNATLAAASGTGTIADDDAPTLSIDSPSVTEGDSGTATLTFTVTLSAASAQTVTVGYADAGTGTATSGTDYTAIPAGTLTFAAGTTSQPIAVTVTGDATDEADETVVVRLSSPVNATLAAASGTGTIADDDDADLRVRLKGINEAILPDLSRTMIASTMDAVTGRIGQALSPDGAAAHGAMAPADVLTGFAGLLQANEQALEDGTWSWKQGLDGRRFALALSGDGERDGAGGGAVTDAGARVTAWGAGDYRSLAGDGDGSGVDWDGHLFGAHLGMDARFGAGGLAGLALSVSKGSFDYTDTSAGETVEGEYESRMTSAHPYVGWAWPAGRHAWASLGYGRGDVTLLDGEAGRQTSDSTLHSAAAGGSVRVLSGEGPGVFGPVTVDLKGEAWTTRLAVEDNGERIAGLAVRTHRLRVAAEGARAFALGGGAAFTPSVEVGMRLDGGDGETGAGVELGGGLDYAHPALGLSADVAGRVLLAHEGGTEDWSVGGAVRLEPASGLGPSLRLAPSYGETGSGLSRLWEGGVAGSGATGTTGASAPNGASPTARLDTEMGYGLAAFAGVLTPYGGLALSEGGARGYRLGARFLLGPAFELGLEGERRESRTERAEHGLMLRGRVRW